jgi:hypothetical protein
MSREDREDYEKRAALEGQKQEHYGKTFAVLLCIMPFLFAGLMKDSGWSFFWIPWLSLASSAILAKWIAK